MQTKQTLCFGLCEEKKNITKMDSYWSLSLWFYHWLLNLLTHNVAFVHKSPALYVDLFIYLNKESLDCRRSLTQGLLFDLVITSFLQSQNKIKIIYI